MSRAATLAEVWKGKPVALQRQRITEYLNNQSKEQKCVRRKGKRWWEKVVVEQKRREAKTFTKKLSNVRAKYYISKFELWWVEHKLIPGTVDKLRGLQNMGKNENLEIKGQLLLPIYVLLNLEYHKIQRIWYLR